MTIGPAVALIKAYKRVTREAWARQSNGDRKYLELQLVVDTNLDHDFVAINDGSGLMPWTCSQADLLAEDWVEA